VSLVKVPPDLGVSSQQGSANVWVTDDPQAVIDQEEELAQLDSSEAVIPIEDKLVQSGNVIPWSTRTPRPTTVSAPTTSRRGTVFLCPP
jgi:hypothetical protein